jgi:hypothetical protein
MRGVVNQRCIAGTSGTFACKILPQKNHILICVGDTPCECPERARRGFCLILSTTNRAEDPPMRHFSIALLLAAGLAGLAGSPAGAVGARYPFCIQGDEQPGLSNCTFVSYQQCQATASGRRLWCIPNPFYVGGRGAPNVYRGRGRAPAAPSGFVDSSRD